MKKDSKVVEIIKVKKIIDEILKEGLRLYKKFIEGEKYPDWNGYNKAMRNLFKSYSGSGVLIDYQEAMARIILGEKGKYGSYEHIDDVVKGNYGLKTQAYAYHKKEVEDYFKIRESFGEKMAQEYLDKLPLVNQAIVIEAAIDKSGVDLDVSTVVKTM